MWKLSKKRGLVLMSDDEDRDGRFDIPDAYAYFYENRNEDLFADFSLEEFIEYLKKHT